MFFQSLNAQLIGFGLLAISLTVIAGAIPLLNIWKEDHLHGFVSFSAGILIATAFLHLLPEACDRIPAIQVGSFIITSFLVLYILEKFIMLHPCEETHCDYHTMGVAAFVGMLIHTLFDGIILGASFFVEGLGWLIFFAIMAHKVPSSFALASILKKGGWSARKVLFSIFIFGAVIPLGAFASTFALKIIGKPAIGTAMALSLGTFLYIAISDFLPEVHRVHNRRIINLISFLLGIFVIAATTFLIRGEH